MAEIQCGARIRYGNFEQGTSGCLVRFTDTPNRVLMLAAGHVVLPSFAQKNDAINAVDLPDTVIGRLLTWTNFNGNPTADAALVWVDPSLVSPVLAGIGAPQGTNVAPQVGDTVRIVPHPGQTASRETKITQLAADVDVLAAGPNWSETLTYRGQILCSPMISEPGDSGAIAVDRNGLVVGMVVAGSDTQDATLLTPIAGILTNAAWRGGQLEILSAKPDDAVGPPSPAILPVATEAKVDLSSLPMTEQPIATMILDAFEAAGFSLFQRVAALANAIAESSLNPAEHAQTTKEDSVGLFQLNRNGGAGKGYSVEQLLDPEFNIKIVIGTVKNIAEFVNATSLDDAVNAFVRRFEVPANVDAEVVKRQKIANGLVSV